MSMSRNAWRRIGWCLLASLVVLLVWISAISFRRDLPGASAQAAQSTASKGDWRVYALGRLEPASRIRRISAPSGNDGASVERLLVSEGDLITPNQPLARLDNYARRAAAVAEAAAKVRTSSAKLNQVKAGAKQGDISAQVSLSELWARQSNYASRELERAKKLRERGILGDEEFDNKQWGLDRLLLEHQRAEHQLTSLREIRDVDVEVAAADLSADEAALKSAQEDLAVSEIVAPIAGRILRIHARQGERLGDNGLLEMGDVNRMQAVAEVFEADILSVHVGQSAEVRLQGTGIHLQGQVAEVGYLVGRRVVLTNDPVSDTDARVIEVRIDLSAEDSRTVERLSQSRVEILIPK